MPLAEQTLRKFMVRVHGGARSAEEGRVIYPNLGGEKMEKEEAFDVTSYGLASDKNAIKSFVENTLTLDCFLNAFSLARLENRTLTLMRNILHL